MHQAKAFLPQSVNDVLSAPFFVIFWHLATSDITFSAETYQKAIDRISAIDKDISTWRTTAVSEAKAERLRLKAQIDTLVAERDVQQALVNGPIRRRLRSESSKWFGKGESPVTCRSANSSLIISHRREESAKTAQHSAASILLLPTRFAHSIRCRLCGQVYPSGARSWDRRILYGLCLQQC